MQSYVRSFSETDRTMLTIVGGKGANLGELTTIAGVNVPPGFCITTAAFQQVMAASPSIHQLLEQLAGLTIHDHAAIHSIGTALRLSIEEAAMPADVSAAIRQHLQGQEAVPLAVRSSATAEDLPTASFAGQQDTYLNITGIPAVLQYVSKCWASLFTERAIIYRIQHGFDHQKVQLAVVVQQMVFPYGAGIMFTADPVTGNRKTVSVDAGFGLGEALVSGLVNADHFKIQQGRVIAREISAKQLGIFAAPEGGTRQQAIAQDQQQVSVLTDAQLLALEQLGRKIEAHFGQPQDIEWCLDNDTFFIVQSRPITTLFPIPQVEDDLFHAYISVGHQQMMTDAMKPLGLSLFQLTTPRPMYEAAGRLFVDVAPDLAVPARRAMFTGVLGKSDPLIKDAILTLLQRAEFQVDKADTIPVPMHDYNVRIDYDPHIVAKLIAANEAASKQLKADIKGKTGLDLIDFILTHIRESAKVLFDPQSLNVIITGMNAATWLNDNIEAWLGDKNVADILTQSVANNVTSEMGLELMNVADVLRPYPEVINFLEQTTDSGFLDQLPAIPGGRETAAAITAFLEKYGMRCAGEIDITKTRWAENPAILLPMILNNLHNFPPGAAAQKFAQGLKAATEKEKELLDRLQQLPGGAEKVAETKRMIELVRQYSGYREYPKYSIISRNFVYKQALMGEAARLRQAGVISDVEDIFYLSFEELREVIRTQQADHALIRQRREVFAQFEKLTPPRVMTSDGEIITGKYTRDYLPANAIAGLAVSSGVVEGRARVILDLAEARLEKGDILVTAFTDPSWTPVFVGITGLVTEVGGLMTHGAVIAREYGLPAVVGVQDATKLIKDGQWIRVNGTEGFVEILQE
ncbi:phosphoenolpyruvate synthase [Chitinophaga jiangningensis]|uniref:Prodigiosin synthesizing transferase PigC n=1 Tax=Chitinophaga jiangningensis TaxID=1419482 RepID=A0A1M6Y400_9BACT|nr:rifamycin-inactivating phosphotransferase [Chitinophaga jiangningensis]SHL12946.1 phosphoenolpyruvate synthase [Chitinophaga jiangningensis]